MTALADALPSPKAENTQDDREENNDRPAHTGEGDAGSAGTGFGAAIKQLFREVKALLTAEAPAPQLRRRRRGETDRAFQIAAYKLMHRVAHIPLEAYARATHYLADTLDWLNQWHHHDNDTHDEFQSTPNDRIYPQL
jgi:hypothetical protein